MNDLSGRDLMAFKTWRKSETDIKTVSLNGTLVVLQRFLRFCESIEAVEGDLADRVPLPNVPPDEEVRTDVPEDEAVKGVVNTTDVSNTHRVGAPSSNWLRRLEFDLVHSGQSIRRLRFRR